MSNIKDVIAYILANSDRSKTLSNARLTKIVYLADWKRAIDGQTTISDIQWYFDHFGPFAWDVVNTARGHPKVFTVSESPLANREKQTLIRLVDRRFKPRLEAEDRDAIDHVIRVTKDLGWPEFIRLVYSTFPVANTDKYQYLDLLNLAKAYAEYLQETKGDATVP